jgi:hypothetical protein
MIKGILTEEYLREQYMDQRKSLSEIAIANNCSVYGLYYWFVKYNIPRRSLCEANRIKKNMPCSEATKQKIGNANRGKKKHSAERKAELSKRWSGEGNPTFGKVMSEEQRMKLSIAHKKHIKIHGAPNTGKIFSAEVKLKQSLAKRGEKSPTWKGGISFEPYCPAFTKALKEEIRNKFGRRCFLSGQFEKGRRLSIHHCDYLKSQGCKGQRWSLLPLELRWHSRTNVNRWYWFAILRDYWVYKYLTFHGMDIFDGPDRTTWLWEIYDQ